MRIVYVTQRLPFGAGETFVTPEVEALLEAGHELLIVPRLSADPVLHDDVAALVARVRPVPGALTVAAAVARGLVRQPRRTVRAFWRLRRARPRRRVLFNALATAEGVWLAGVARAWGADHIHAHWAHLTATLAMGASEVSGIPWSFTAHRYDVVLNNLLAEKLRSARFGRFIAREMLDRARQLVGPDDLARALVLHMGVPIPPPFPARTSARATPVVLCPARLVPMKGHAYLLNAAARLMARGVGFELRLAGGGPGAPALARRIEELALGDRVRMLGAVPHAELLRLYGEGAVDCVVLPSLDLGGGLHEGLSVALIEAMAHGVPVIATRTGGLPELLEGGAGVLVPPADADALAEALERVLGSAEIRAELARAGRRRIAEEFDVATIARELARRFAGEVTDDRARAPQAEPALTVRQFR
jgi:colanic acid/amylovoran biosynthesis glycosyltransferase